MCHEKEDIVQAFCNSHNTNCNKSNFTCFTRLTVLSMTYEKSRKNIRGKSPEIGELSCAKRYLDLDAVNKGTDTSDLDEARVVYEQLVDGTVSVEDIFFFFFVIRHSFTIEDLVSAPNL